MVPASVSSQLILSHLVDGAAEALWPTRCVGCDRPGTLLCPHCRAALPWIDQRWACLNCGAPAGWLACSECDEPWETRAVACALPFAGVGTRLVTAYKDGHERRLAPVLAVAIACALDEARAWPAPDGRPRFDPAATDALCFVPATERAFVRRGFDHMEGVARALSALEGIPMADVLARGPARDQRSLGRSERAANLRDSVEVVSDVAGLSLLLVDDVITTGASIRACAQALRDHGAREVSACALARVW